MKERVPELAGRFLQVASSLAGYREHVGLTTEEPKAGFTRTLLHKALICIGLRPAQMMIEVDYRKRQSLFLREPPHELEQQDRIRAPRDGDPYPVAGAE